MMYSQSSRWTDGSELVWQVERDGCTFDIRLYDTKRAQTTLHLCGVPAMLADQLRIKLGQELQDSATVEMDGVDLNFNPKVSK